MSSTARNAQGAVLTIGVSGSAKTLTGASKANPLVATSAAHALSEGIVGVFSGVTGMPEANGRVGIVRNPATNTFEAAGIDSTGFAAVGTAGTFTPTACTVGNFKGFSGIDGQASDIDVTDFASVAKEFRAGLVDYGSFQIQVQWRELLGDVGQDALRASQLAAGPSSVFKLTFKDGKYIQFNAYVKQFSISGQVDGIVEGSVTMKISGGITLG